MDLTPVFEDILTVLPELAARLQKIAAKFHDHGTPAAAVNPEPEKIPVPRPKKVILSVPEDDLQKQDSGAKKLNAKPNPTKAKFSSITGPDIYYDGESQRCLFECWTALNAKRGVLRKEMMQMKRKKVLTLPSVDYGYSDSDDEIEADDSGEEEESEEDKIKRMEEERRKALEEKRKAEMEKKKTAFLEYVDGCLDKAAKACENAAFVWLKGEACSGHVVFITQRMVEAMDRIRYEKEQMNPKVDDDDEGFGDEIGLGEELEHSEEELPHKKAGPSRRPERPDPGPSDNADNDPKPIGPAAATTT